MSNPNQEIIESRLATYIDGELEDNERLEIEQHLQQNPQYRKVIEDLRKQRDMLRGLPREAAPLDIAEAFTNQLERAELLDPVAGRIDRRPTRMSALPRLMAAAAIVLLTVGLGVIVYIVLPDRNVQKYSVAPLGSKSISPATTAPVDETLDDRSDNNATPDERVPAKAGGQKTAVSDSLTPPADNAPALPQRPANANDRKNAVRDGMEYAALKSMAQPLGRDEPRDAELDRLAESVSKDPQVKALLARDFDEKRSVALGAPPLDKARVVVVRANDPKQVAAELTNLFGRENVDWHPAPKPLELALNTSLAQQSEDALQSNGAANKREINDKAVENEKLAELNDRVAVGRGVGKTPEGDFAAPSRQQQGQQGFGQTARGNVSEKLAAKDAAAAPADKGVNRQRQAGMASANAANEGMSLSSAAAFDEQEKLRAGPAKAQAFVANPAPVQTMFVARRLSRAQVAELNACLAQNAELKKTDEYRQLGEYRLEDSRAGLSVAAAPQSVEGAIAAPPAAAAAAPRASITSVPGSIGRNESFNNAGRGAGSGGRADHGPAGTAQGANAPASSPPPTPAPAAEPVPAPAPVTSLTAAATRPDSIVRKGDELRVQFAAPDKSAESLQTVKVQEDGTISPQGKPVQVAGKTLDEVKKALLQSQPSPAAGGRAGSAPSAVSVERVSPEFGYKSDQLANHGEALGAEKQAESGQQQFGTDLLRRASGNGLPTTQPNLDVASADDTVDVVIVIQQRPGAVDTIVAPTPAPVAADKPAASIAPANLSTATTRPASPGK